MLLTNYLDSIENTEQEQEFLHELAELREHFVPAAKVPFVGKKIAALIDLIDCGSISDFRDAGYYDDFDGWEIVHHKIGGFSIYPGKEQMRKALAVVGLIFGLIVLAIFIKKCTCKK